MIAAPSAMIDGSRMPMLVFARDTTRLNQSKESGKVWFDYCVCVVGSWVIMVGMTITSAHRL
jgi:hypothetical protein